MVLTVLVVLVHHVYVAWEAHTTGAKTVFSKQGISSLNCMHDRLMNVVIIYNIFIYTVSFARTRISSQLNSLKQMESFINVKLNFCIYQEQTSTC